MRSIYCLVPQDLAEELHEPLRAHFAYDPTIVVVVEHRKNGATEAGVVDQRAPFGAVPTPPLPRRARPHQGRLRFVEQIEPADSDAEDEDTNRLVALAQRGDQEAFSALYLRYFDRVYRYVRIALRDSHEAEDITQTAFLQAFSHLDRFEIRPRQPFRPWLLRIAGNLVIDHCRKHRPALLEDPEQLIQARQEAIDYDTVESTLAWLTSSEVELFVERLPLAQRQVLTLRHLMDFSVQDTAAVLDRTQGSVRMLDSRARHVLAARLTAIGRRPAVGRRQHAKRLMRQIWVLRARRHALRG
jgi:RNA polymerase sigma-70 factor (ECF subfamily)